MGLRIEDGKGKGNEVGVSGDNQLLTLATTQELGLQQAHAGRAFFASTGLISLTTTASFNGLLYILNGHQTDMLHIAAGHFGTNGIATTFKVVKNPKSGTLISGGTTITPYNVNFGSGAGFIGTAKKGANALTITDGDDFLFRQVGEVTISDALKFVIMPPQSSIAVLAQPSAAAVVNIGLLVYYHREG
jgi:hypothetical protein